MSKNTIETFNFLTPEITQADLVNFASERVNLSRDHAKKYREQAGNVRDHIERYISENADIGFVKMLISGSLAKGTALRTINDIDMALYVKSDKDTPTGLLKLLDWIAERLRETFPQIPSDKIYIDEPTVVIEFAGTGLKIEVMPILDAGTSDGQGYLWDRVPEASAQFRIRFPAAAYCAATFAELPPRQRPENPQSVLRLS